MKSVYITLVLAGLFAAGCAADDAKTNKTNMTATTSKIPENAEYVTLGAGCFWCTEAVFQQIPGVLSVTSGYMGGSTKNPTYEQICTGETGHAEVSRVAFDPKKTSMEKILAVFWEAHDPTSLNRQGADSGTQYRSAIFTTPRRSARPRRSPKRRRARNFRSP